MVDGVPEAVRVGFEAIELVIGELRDAKAGDAAPGEGAAEGVRAGDDPARCAEGELGPYGRDEAVWGHGGGGGALVVLFWLTEILFRVTRVSIIHSTCIW